MKSIHTQETLADSPVGKLNRLASAIARKQEEILDETGEISSAEENSLVEKLEPGLIILQAQLEYYFPIGADTRPSAWMDLFDAFDADPEWLEEGASLVESRYPELAAEFRKLAQGYRRLIPLTFAAWVWSEAEAGFRPGSRHSREEGKPRLAA